MNHDRLSAHRAAVENSIDITIWWMDTRAMDSLLRLVQRKRMRCIVRPLKVAIPLQSARVHRTAQNPGVARESQKVTSSCPIMVAAAINAIGCHAPGSDKSRTDRNTPVMSITAGMVTKLHQAVSCARCPVDTSARRSIIDWPSARNSV